MTKPIVIACDHAGLPLKQLLKNSFPGVTWLDLGTDTPDSVDYPDYASKLAAAIKDGKASKGILICGSGTGMAMAANRFAHIRAAVATNVTTARLAREHNDANVLCLGARLTGFEIARECVEVFLATEFMGGRHQKRVDKMSMC